MRCPNCGSKIPEGHLYCDQCGAEIIIVPDFEPEVENEINSSLSSVAHELTREDRAVAERERRRRELVRQARSRKRAIARIVFTLFAICFAALSINMYRLSTASRYLQLAEDAKKSGKYDVAISFLEEGYKKNPNNTDIIFRIADCYLEKGEPEQAINELKTITEKGNYSKEIITVAYESIISIYKQTKEYDKIAEILNQSDNEIIAGLKDKYTSVQPEMTVKTEELKAPVTVELTPADDSSNTIYYTINGEIPDKNSTLYEKEIVLEEAGEYNIKAVAFNSYGIPSVVTENDYNVEKGAPAAPEIMEDSGDYVQNTMIVVYVQDGCTAYYTTDGSDPTEESERYDSPINMPMGTSNFKFIAYDDEGDCSEIVEREYHLALERHLDAAQAVNSLVSTLLKLGYILDDHGSVIGGGHNEYIYQGTVDVPNAGEYYKIVEEFVAADGSRTATGLMYAVNTNDGTVNRLLLDSNQQYMLKTISNR